MYKGWAHILDSFTLIFVLLPMCRSFLFHRPFAPYINYTMIHRMKWKRNNFMKQMRAHTQYTCTTRVYIKNNNKRFLVIKWLCSNWKRCRRWSVKQCWQWNRPWCRRTAAYTGRVNLLIEFIKNTYWFYLFWCAGMLSVRNASIRWWWCTFWTLK